METLLQRSAECECDDTVTLPTGDLTIGQAAHATGLTAKAIRYYEDIGLLPRAARGDNRYRRYTPADVNRLILLRRIRLLGVPLAAARRLVKDVAGARCADVRQDLLALVDERLDALDRELAELHALRGAVERYQRALADCHPDEAALFAACTDLRCVAEPGDCSNQVDQEDDDAHSVRD
jgi:MerR family transcriptional regulator, copper efflux regulator